MSEPTSSDEVSPRPSFRPIQTRSLFAMSALGLQALVELWLVLLLGYRIQLVTQVRNHIAVSRQDLLASDSATMFVSRIILVLMIIAGVTFLLWLYRASQNLRAFRPGPFEHSPSLAWIPMLAQ